jgi:predicted alpha/beta-fold hydrolase
MGAMGLMPHLWTVGPRVRHSFLPFRAPASHAWATSIDDPRMGPVGLSGRLTEAASAAGRNGGPAGAAGGGEARELLVMVHGMAGSIDSHYMVRAAGVAQRAGLASLRLNLRGSDGSGDDFYHAALTADLHAALASEALARFERIYLLGFSLGGHVALRLAGEQADPRLRSVAAVCTPLDLAASSRQIDSPASWLYRRYLIGGMAKIYATVAARRPVPLPVAEAARIHTMREWDEQVVAPHHGFAGAEDYYARASAGPRLAALRLPTLLVSSERDPMVPAHTVRAALPPSTPGLDVRWIPAGGHVAFPARLDLGQGGEPGLVNQVMRWLRRA